MQEVKNGDSVEIHYTGKFENGEVFETSRDRQPMEFTVGTGTLLPVIEKGLVGMKIGESRTIQALPQEAFGPWQESLVVKINRSRFPDHIALQNGQPLRIPLPNGNDINLIIQDVGEDTVTLDGNHPLAGHTLFVDVELISIAKGI